MTIINLDAIISGSNIYDSPHVCDGKPCLGEWKPKVNKLIATMDFKNLVLLAKLSLKGYNPESPHLNLESFKVYRKKQKIRDDEIPEAGIENDRNYLNKNRKDEET